MFRIIFIFPLLYLSQLLGEEEIKIGTLHGQLRFDPEIIVVKRGAEINLVFENQDEMIHNLLIAKGDSKNIDRLAEKALALGEKDWIWASSPKTIQSLQASDWYNLVRVPRLLLRLRERMETILMYAHSRDTPCPCAGL